MSDHRLYQTVAERLKKRIADGVYLPGDRLPGERELADEFGVSRVTVREAEIALQAMGFIEVKPGSGAYVVERAPTYPRDLPTVTALELTQARLLFESEAAALAARAITDETLAHLTSLVSVMSQSNAKGGDASLAADREFHLAIAAACGNAAVQDAIERLWRMRTELPNVLEAHAVVCSEDLAQERGKEHDRILAALRKRDPSEARSAMQDHFSRLLASIIDASEAHAVEALRVEAAARRQRFLQGFMQTDGA
ncbi:MAG: FCD domain-containing protein [Pseudomonadota bacterium]